MTAVLLESGRLLKTRCKCHLTLTVPQSYYDSGDKAQKCHRGQEESAVLLLWLHHHLHQWGFTLCSCFESHICPDLSLQRLAGYHLLLQLQYFDCAGHAGSHPHVYCCGISVLHRLHQGRVLNISKLPFADSVAPAAPHHCLFVDP